MSHGVDIEKAESGVRHLTSWLLDVVEGEFGLVGLDVLIEQVQARRAGILASETMPESPVPNMAS